MDSAELSDVPLFSGNCPIRYIYLFLLEPLVLCVRNKYPTQWSLQNEDSDYNKNTKAVKNPVLKNQIANQSRHNNGQMEYWTAARDVSDPF